VDSAGKKVSDRSISSLAAEKNIVWLQESTVVNGTGATMTRMELYLNKTFTKACRGGEGRLPDASSAISIETYVFSGSAMIEYGNETLEVVASSLKYNIRSTNWPFCAEGNSLQVNMEVKVKGDKPPKLEKKDMEKEEQERMKSGKKGKGVKGNKFRANAGKRDLEMDLPTLSLVDGELVDSEVEMDAKGAKTSVTFTFPHFNQTLLYDPTAGLEEPTSSEAGTFFREWRGERRQHEEWRRRRELVEKRRHCRRRGELLAARRAHFVLGDVASALRFRLGRPFLRSTSVQWSGRRVLITFLAPVPTRRMAGAEAGAFAVFCLGAGVRRALAALHTSAKVQLGWRDKVRARDRERA